MPTLSAFFGIVIRMYYDDHSPPHFPAIYGEHEAQIAVDTLEVLHGSLPKRALALVLEWAALHRGELRGDWRRAEQHEQLQTIDPLE